MGVEDDEFKASEVVNDMGQRHTDGDIGHVVHRVLTMFHVEHGSLPQAVNRQDGGDDVVGMFTTQVHVGDTGGTGETQQEANTLDATPVVDVEATAEDMKEHERLQ